MKKNRDFLNALKTGFAFFNMVREEVIKSPNLYGGIASKRLLKYYSSLYKNMEYSDYALYRYAQRVIYLINNIKKGTKFLDAGCGTGSEAILGGILGGDVVGIDINGDSITTAEKRLKYYESKLKKKINVQFYSSNIFNHSGKYDLIWVNEAISHITPLEKFLQRSYNNLKTGGKFIVADPNRFNPYVYLHGKERQKIDGKYFFLKNSLIGNKVLMANEVYFTIPKIKKMLSNYFKINKVYLSGYVPFFMFKIFKNRIIKFEENFIRKMPIVKLFSLSYVITCQK